MTTRKTRSPTTGKTVEAEVIEIKNISDSAIRIELADGTLLRLKIDIIEVVRFNDEWDPEGNPRYSVKSGNLMSLLDSPENLREGRLKSLFSRMNTNSMQQSNDSLPDGFVLSCSLKETSQAECIVPVDQSGWAKPNHWNESLSCGPRGRSSGAPSISE